MLCHANLMLNQIGMRRAEKKRKAKENMGLWGRGPNDKKIWKRMRHSVSHYQPYITLFLTGKV